MLLLKKKNYYLLSFLAILLILLVACGSDNNPTDDTSPTDDDPDPTGFLGELVWVKTFGGSEVDQAVAVVESNDGGFVVLGSTNSNDGDVDDRASIDEYDYWVIKVNSNGEKQWSKSYGGTNDETATNIQKTSDGGYIISGYSRSNDGDVSGNEGFHDYWILKIDSGGNKQWDKNYGFSGSDKAFSVIQTKDGGYFATGFLDVNESGGQGNDNRAIHSLGDYWGIKMDANGDRIWRRYFGGSHVDESKDVVQTSDDGFLLIGVSESSDFDITDARGGNDMWIVKVSSYGDLLWQKSFGGSEIDFGYAVTPTNDGNFIIVGDTRSSDQDVSTSYGNADIWAVKFNGSNGGLIWEKSYGGGAFDSARGITRLSDGTYLITGNTRSENGDISNNYGLNDAWVIIINDDGDLLLEKTIGGTNLDFANQAVETSNNQLIIVGNTESSDDDISLNKGKKDFVIIKMK